MKAVAIIPARGGSRRIPRKNLMEFRGHPIIAYSIKAAQDSGLFGRIIVSTDDEEISEIAQDYEASAIIRPAHLAEDDVGTQRVVQHAIKICVNTDIACCIYPTAPLMSPADLHRAMDAVRTGSTYAFSVGTTPSLHDAGQFYMGWAWAFREGVPLIGTKTAMIEVDEDRDCDINTMDDWNRALEMHERMYG